MVNLFKIFFGKVGSWLSSEKFQVVSVCCAESVVIGAALNRVTLGLAHPISALITGIWAVVNNRLLFAKN